MDFIFGTFATDALKVVHHRAGKRGVQHQHVMSPRDPLPGDPVRLTVQIGVDLSIGQVACYYTTDGSAPSGALGQATNGTVVLFQQVNMAWDTLAWGYVSHWQAEIPAQDDGTVVRYLIGAWGEDGDEVFADWPVVQDVAEQAAAAFFENRPLPEDVPPPAAPHQFTYHVDRLKPPEWAHEAIIYHVYVDRFYPGDGQAWLQTDNLQDYCGGTLWGVRDKLDYIADLGVNCIWLSPTWLAASYHGYDVIDYTQTDPRLGGDDALRAVVEGAHQRGLRVLLDMVCNHISNRSPVFIAAQEGGDSRDWFYFDDSKIGYRTFFGVPEMPQINTNHPGARQWLIEMAQYWLREFDIDGYRLDYANGPGPDFWSYFRATCRAVKADALCFGEIIDEPSKLLEYVGRLDGCLNFHVGEQLRHAYGLGQRSVADFERFLARQQQFFPPHEDFIMPLFIDSHDMTRFLTVADGDVEKLKQAADIQLSLPYPPIIYYGTEVGMSQTHTHEEVGLNASRDVMVWGDAQNQDVLAHYKQLIERRKSG